VAVSRRSLLVGAVAVAVAVAFADSSIVVLALPELYATFDTTIEGVAWVITSYNLVLAVCALALVLVAHRIRANLLLAAGTIVFLAAGVACALSDSIAFLIAARSVQGLGGALLLAGSLPVLGALTGSTARGVGIWTVAGTFGAAVGPALGGVLTQVFDWRAIFVFQAPVAGAALLATAGSHVSAILEEGWRQRLLRTMPGNLALALLSGALVGALFLGVLLVIDVFGSTPIQGAAIVSVIPATTLLARPLAAQLPVVGAIASGALLLAAGLVGLALLPSSALAYTLSAFALCGFRLPRSPVSRTVLGGEGIGLGHTSRSACGTSGLVALAVGAPLLGGPGGAADVSKLNATLIIDGRIPATTKIPLALDIRDALDRAPEGAIPDLSAPFEGHGAATDASVRALRDELVATIEIAVTRGFRPSFLLCALLAALALVPLAALRRRPDR
jgi:MFS family permease